VSLDASDADLVAQLRRSAPGAFDSLYRLHAERVWRFLHRLSATASAAQDSFQETWLAAARNAHRLREDTQLIPWLLTIARNKHRNALRFETQRAEHHALVRGSPPAGPPPPDEQANARQRMARVEEALRELPEVHREVLLLHLVEGLEPATLARVLDLREDAVRKRLSRARAALEEALHERER
jgi:RNA polymerase sigma-70 factor, ECF subfamily